MLLFSFNQALLTIRSRLDLLFEALYSLARHIKCLQVASGTFSKRGSKVRAKSHVPVQSCCGLRWIPRDGKEMPVR